MQSIRRGHRRSFGPQAVPAVDDCGNVPRAISVHCVPPCPPAARLSLLGGFELQLHGESVELPLAAQRLIAFLALHPRALMRVFVAGSLWMDASESKACSSLRSVLWRLRAHTPIIRATSSHLSLEPWVEIDVADCTDLVRRLRDGDGPPSRTAVSALCDAGDLLPDWYDDWLIVDRERLRQRRLHALEAACDRLTAARRYAEALEAGLAAIAVEPLRETAHTAVACRERQRARRLAWFQPEPRASFQIRLRCAVMTRRSTSRRSLRAGRA